MRYRFNRRLLYLFLCNTPLDAVIIQSSLLQYNGHFIALWGDKHTQTPSTVDTQQLATLVKALETTYARSERSIQILIEEPSGREKQIKKFLYHDGSLILHDAGPMIQEKIGLNTHNIEMRGIANACTMILREKQVTNYLKNFVYDDAHGHFSLQEITVATLIDSFNAQKDICKNIIEAQPLSERSIWQQPLNESIRNFEQLHATISCDPATPFLTFKQELATHDESLQAAFAIKEAFARLFDIQVADQILKTSATCDVALCAGFLHTDTIEKLLLSNKDIHITYRSPRESTRTRPLEPEHIDVFTPKPTLAQRLLKYLCRCSEELE